MAQTNRATNRELETFMGEVTEYGTRNAENLGSAPDMSERKGGLAGVGAGLATLVSIIALAFSAFSFYETVLKQPELRFYKPPLIYMYREAFRDVFAIPVTISNDGAQRGTILSFDLTIENLETKATMNFQNLHYGSSPKENKRLFTPITVPGRNSFTDVVLFHALKTGSFVSTTGGVKLPLRLTLTMNVDRTAGWFARPKPAPIIFDMTASLIAGFRDMERGVPTQLHDARWIAGKASAQ